MSDGIGEFGMRRRRRDLCAVIMAAPTHHRPAIVLAGLWNIHLVAAFRPELALPKLAGHGMDRRALRVPVPIGPDLRPRTLLTHERIILRHRAVGIDAHDLAEI